MLATLKAFDIRCTYAVAHYNRSFLRPLCLLLEISGNGLLWFALCAYAYCTTTDHKAVICLFVVGLITDLAIVGPLKYLVRRRRPETSASYLVSVDCFSFPSGHTTRAVYVAAFFLHFTKMSALLSALVVAWAAAVATSRVLLLRHFFSDVLCGAVIGRLNFALVVAISTMALSTGAE